MYTSKSVMPAMPRRILSLCQCGLDDHDLRGHGGRCGTEMVFICIIQRRKYAGSIMPPKQVYRSVKYVEKTRA